jgi:hypothetical protein
MRKQEKISSFIPSAPNPPKARGRRGFGEIDLILWTDSIDEAIAHLQENAVKQFGLRVA